MVYARDKERDTRLKLFFASFNGGVGSKKGKIKEAMEKVGLFFILSFLSVIGVFLF